MVKPIMIQGTMSNAGKSLITAGLCRIFQQDGYRTAPFKSQNMALNSYVTHEGLEMGRAQVVQAEAARVEPSVLMNPILLKPSSETGCQVIIKGEVAGNMSAAAYFASKASLRPVIMESYGQLAEKHDIIVIEGAGSPAEINLKQDDIVNMGLADMVNAPVLLVGDIDRGGVFASLYGTIALLEPNERQRIKGLIINKFRGDANLLRPGLDKLEHLTQVPVLGTIPYLDIDIDDEDSLSNRLDNRQTSNDQAAPVRIAVIRLPHIANFTDFNALSRYPGVSLYYINHASELASSDLMILPGTKNTMADLLWLRQCGLETVIKSHVSAGIPILGICGGYQMMGLTLSDPAGVEHGGTMEGLGLLPVDTVFSGQKVLKRVAGTVSQQQGIWQPLSQVAIAGYEIHMGLTTVRDMVSPFVDLSSGLADGAVYGNACGSYIHGLLDGDLGRSLVSMLRQMKGLPHDDSVWQDTEVHKQQQYDKLADSLRQNLDMQRIYAILGI